MPPFVQDCKRDLSQNPVEDWEKGIQTFLWRFSSPSSSSLRWLLATYKPSEHPKPRATQHFWGQARKAWGKSWSLCCHVQRQQESWFCLQHPAFPLKWVFSLHKCGRVGGQNKRHFIENDGGHEGSSKRNTYGVGVGGEWVELYWKWLNPTSVSAKRIFCDFSTLWRVHSRCKHPCPSL